MNAPVVSLSPGRCAWCARFVAADTEPTCWWIKVAEPYQQISDDPWNVFARTLCPNCARGNDAIFTWRRPAVFAEALARQINLAEVSS